MGSPGNLLDAARSPDCAGGGRRNLRVPEVLRSGGHGHAGSEHGDEEGQAEHVGGTGS